MAALRPSLKSFPRGWLSADIWSLFIAVSAIPNLLIVASG
jgi:hypothetical protein